GITFCHVGNVSPGIPAFAPDDINSSNIANFFIDLSFYSTLTIGISNCWAILLPLSWISQINMRDRLGSNTISENWLYVLRLTINSLTVTIPPYPSHA